MKIGFLTSGGDCQGLNAALRGVAKTLFDAVPYVEIYGIQGGYRGLIDCNWRKMEMHEFSGILREGGTILGTSRQPYKTIRDADDSSNVDRLTTMVKNYHSECLDALVILGGNGTHKTAYALSQYGINIVTLPKTIDNDLHGTDYSFGFDSAVAKATDVIDTLHSTAAAHGRVFVCELMGRKAGWVALYAGIAGGADVILLPEIPYMFESVLEVIEKRNKIGKNFSIIAIAEGAVTKDSVDQPKKRERKAGDISPGMELVRQIDEMLKQDVRLVIPGHFQRGGDPTPTDRVFCSRLGAMAGELVLKRKFGYMVALQGNSIGAIALSEVAGKLKTVPLDCEVLKQARLLGISLGE
ncbi:MAG: ATP-dependent 6-phosphofructokinase [Oscillospiraceae bacterium]|nr:ATP-dependent 6-phosphofructokinase [Oscillospiraceae bacterium]MCL2278429.1 ATP-dependent 6-phosphofructokinase [Oscillospiraceae bacterium]